MAFQCFRRRLLEAETDTQSGSMQAGSGGLCAPMPLYGSVDGVLLPPLQARHFRKESAQRNLLVTVTAARHPDSRSCHRHCSVKPKTPGVLCRPHITAQCPWTPNPKALGFNTHTHTDFCDEGQSHQTGRAFQSAKAHSIARALPGSSLLKRSQAGLKEMQR